MKSTSKRSEQFNRSIVVSNIEMIYAIETLEYHNKKHLYGDDKTRNETKRSLLLECISILGNTAKSNS